MTSEPIRATRVMKARKESLCGWCGGWVIRHEQIAFTDDVGWQHVRCLTKRQADWSAIAEPTDAEQARRHEIEQARALDFLRTQGKRV